MKRMGETRAGNKLYLPSQKRSDTEVMALIADASRIPGVEQSLGQSAEGCSLEYYNGPMIDDPAFIVSFRGQICIEIHGQLLTGEPDFIADVLANFEYGGIKAVDAFLESIDCYDFDPDLSKVDIAHWDCSHDTTENAAEVVYQDLSESDVIELIDDVLHYDGSKIKGLIPGDEDGVIHIRKGHEVASNLSVSETTPLQVEFCGELLKAMSVSDFGNFLHTLKHHGQDVALATLNRIYSKE